MPRAIIGRLQSYPHQRSSLTEAHKKIYLQEYRINREWRAAAEALAKRLEVWMHHRRMLTARIRDLFTDVSEVPPQQSYHQVISVAALEHLTELPGVMAQSALLLESDGRFQAGFASEGGLLWYLSWRFGTGLSYWWRTHVD